MKTFENFDWKNFWEDSDYALEEYIGKKPANEEIKEVEKELGYKLPDSYIELIKNQNGGIPACRAFYSDEVTVHITGIYGIDKSKEYSLCGELGNALWLNEWGYPDIGVAVAETISGGHDMVFLDYRDCGKDGEPKVALVDQEDNYYTYILADTFEEFIKGLAPEVDMNIDSDEFQRLSEIEKMRVIKAIQNLGEEDSVIKLLNDAGTENLSTELLGELARAYNNIGEMDKAIETLNMVKKDKRDAMWYYRLGYAHAMIAENPNSDLAAEREKALEMFEWAIEIAENTDNSKVIVWCIETVEYMRGLFLEDYKEKFPLLYKYYAEPVGGENDTLIPEAPKKKKTYKKITVEDVKNTTDAWEITEPLFWIIYIYGSYDEYLKSAESFSVEQRYLNAVMWYYMEVNNGGNYQFLTYSTGIVWEDALNGFRLFKMNDMADNFQKLIDYLGGSLPFDRDERCALISEFEDEDSFEELLDEVDNFVFNSDDDGDLINYIRENPEKFIFDWYYYEGC